MSNPLTDVERLAIHTEDGLGLRAELLGARSAPGQSHRALAVLCHPHPLHGGTMHSHVISALFTALPAVGVATIRFNFRGTSGSEGRHGGGGPERFDVVAAIEAITDRHGGDGRTGGRTTPVVLVGYSFGALVALSVEHRAVAGWLAVAPPLGMTDDEPFAARDARTTVIVVGTDDDFTPAATMERITADWVATTVVALPDEDHFLATATQRLRTEAEAFVDRLDGY